MEGPDVISRTISRPHGVSTRNFVIEHVLGVFDAGTGPGLRVAMFTIEIHERDTVAVAVTSVGTLC